jgi:hypothetical protein
MVRDACGSRVSNHLISQDDQEYISTWLQKFAQPLPKKVRKNRSRAGLALVAQAVSPANRDFFTAS